MKLLAAQRVGRERRRGHARRPGMSRLAAAAGWLILSGLLDAMTGLDRALAVQHRAADRGHRSLTNAARPYFGGGAVALAIGAGWWDGIRGHANYWAWVTVVCAVSAMAVVVAGMRRRREERLARMTAVAEAAQLGLLPPLPPEMTGITIAARYRSATREASVGGDLYEIIPTGHGIRVIIGDVRGKGLGAVPLARQVLSAFRRERGRHARHGTRCGRSRPGHCAAPGRGGLRHPRRWPRSLPAGELTIVNCGHHPPLLRHRGDLRPTDRREGRRCRWALRMTSPRSPRPGRPVTGCCSTPTGSSKAATPTGTSSRKTRSKRRCSHPAATRHWTP